MTCLLGIGFLLFTFWDIRTGEADLLSWLGGGLEVTRKENGIFFWLAIILQLLVALGLIVLGVVLHLARG